MANLSNFRLLLPEVIWLEPQHFNRAREISQQVTGEAHEWQIYLNALAFLGFEQWLGERLPEQPVNRDTNRTEAICHFKVGEFKLCLIATEHLLDEVVSVPEYALDNPDFIEEGVQWQSNKV